MKEAVSELLNRKKDEYSDLDGGLRWDLLKFDIQNLFRTWKTKLYKENQRPSEDLQNHISDISSQEDISEADFETLQALRRELFAIQKSSEHKAMLRSKARWAMYAGKPSKSFLKLEKNAYTDKVITQIQDPSGRLVDNPEDILKVEKAFFREIYKKGSLPPHSPTHILLLKRAPLVILKGEF